MRTRHVFFALTLTVLLLAVGVWILGFFRSTLTTKRLAVEQEAPDVKAVLGGRSLDTISLAGVGAVYPQFRSRQDYTTDLAMRTQDCFERSMNGRAPALECGVEPWEGGLRLRI